MPTLETPEELADRIADQVGVYGAHEDDACTEQRPCRPCYVLDLTERIRASVGNENLLVATEQRPAPPPPRVRVPRVEQLVLPAVPPKPQGPPVRLVKEGQFPERLRARQRALADCTCDLTLTGLHRDYCPVVVQGIGVVQGRGR